MCIIIWPEMPKPKVEILGPPSWLGVQVIYIYVYIYIYIYVYIHVNYVYIYVKKYMYIYIYMYLGQMQYNALPNDKPIGHSGLLRRLFRRTPPPHLVDS